METKCEKAKEDFENISKTIKEEIKRFDFNRAKEFKNELTKYLQALLSNQEQVKKLESSMFLRVTDYACMQGCMPTRHAT